MKKAISMLLVVCLILSIFPMGTVYAVGEESERAPEAETEVVADPEPRVEKSAAQRNGNLKNDPLEETDPEEPTDPTDPTEPTEPTEPEEPTPPEVTRAQWVQCLVAAFNMTILEQNAPDNYYSDLDGTEDYYRDILVATAFGIIDIDAGLPFYPDEAATREFAAQTMNACLRYHLEDTEYTFAEADSVSYPGDIQTAVNHGWFTLDDENRFFPEQALTEAEQAVLLAIIATELEAEEIDPNYESVYEYADGVIEVPDGTEVTVGDDTITITDCPVQIATGSTFVVYCKSFPQAYLAESVRTVNGITTITASRVNQNDVIVAIDAQGIIDMDFSDIPQDEENSIVFIDEVTGMEYTNGAECERAVAQHPNMRGTKGGSKSISWKQDITLADGVKVSVSFKLKDPVYKYKLDTKNGIVCAYVDGDYTVSCGASMSSIPSGASDIKIGKGIPFLYICELALYLHLDAKGSATWNGSGHMKVGIDYSRTDGLKDPFSYEADGFYLEAKVSGKIGLQLRVGLNSIVGEVVEGYVYGEIGGAVTIKQKTYEGDVTPKQCTDAAIYAYLEAGAKVKIKFPFHSAFTAEYNHKIWDEKNSPARVYKHYEDGVQVTSCTHGEASGNGYYTGSGSNYSGSGYGDGSGGSAYGIGSDGNPVLLYTYTVDSDNNATITGYTGSSNSVSLPSSIDSYPVIAIGNQAFKNNNNIHYVYIPSGIVTIGSYSFQGCSNLAHVSIPNSTNYIGVGAFSNCTNLSDVVLTCPGVTISYYAFNNCYNLNTVTIPDSTVFYGNNYDAIFEGTNVTLIISPDTGIVGENFLYSYSKASGGYRGRQCGIKKIVLEEGIVKIGNSAFYQDINDYTFQTVETIILPSTVTDIGSNAFRNNSFSTITMPTGDPEIVTSIGGSAFYGCRNLISICIPEGVVTLNNSTFAGCSSIENVFLPTTLTTIGSYVFQNCSSLVSASLPAGVSSIGNYAFSGCSSLASIQLTNDMTSISTCCFYQCSSLREIFIPSNITLINQEAFSYCTALETVSIANTTQFTSPSYTNEYYNFFYGDEVTLCVRADVDSISDSWLYNKTAGIKNIYIEEGIISIGAKAFYSSKPAKTIKEVVLPESLISLGASAFYDCASLETINLPSKLTSINDYTFYGCKALKNISIHDRIMKLGSHVFDGAGLEIVVVPSSVTEMGTYNFANCTSLTSVTLPVARRKIEDYTFYNCSALTTITLPRLVDTIGVSAFQGCSSLAEINWSERITTLSNSSFRGCSTLQDVVIPETVTSIGTYAFADCTALTSITLPENTTSLANYLLSGCTALQTYEFPANVTSIGDGVFSECSSLENVILPEGLQSLGQKVFYNCDALQSIVIPAETKTFGAQCFYDCDALQSLTLPNSVTSIGTYFCYSCDNLSSITLSEGMTVVPEAAFMDCSALNNVIVPRRVTTINSNAFNVCPSLTWIMIPASATTIAGNALSYPDRTVIYGRNGSYAETYADEYGYEFVVYEVNATDVTLSDSTLSIPRGRTATLIATVNPTDYTDDVTWKSTNTSVVTVSDDGVVTAVGVGTATVRMVVGSVSASCRVTVIEPVTRITLNKTTLSLDARESATLSATVTPSAATIKTVQWTSSNETVATVDENGVVTAVGKGTATITATAEDGTGIYATCAVTVTGNFIIAESIDELQSPHPYENNSKDYWSYTVDGADKLYVTFSELTTVEEESDYLYIYDGDGNLIGTYTGEVLAGQTIEVPGDTVVIKLVSDNSYSEYGFSVTAVGMEEPPHEHTFGEWELTKEPSCTEVGIETRTCTVCGESETREVEALGHDYVETVVAPSCVVQGYTLHTCSRCADSYKDSYTDPLGHSFVQGICERCGVADPAYENAALVISGGPITALPGDTITVPIMITGGAGFAGFTLSITTSDGLTLKNIEKGELLNESDGSLTKNIAQGKVNWTDTAETTGDGELLLLTIELSETAGTDETITIRLKDNKSTNMVDINGQAVTTRFEDIVISTQTVLYGDTNSDGDIDTSDAVRLVRYLVDLVELTELQKQAADVTHDNDITSADSIKLVRYLVGMVDTLSSLPTRGIHRAIEAGEINTANVTGEAGETVTVPVTISGNPGFAGFTLEIGYPAELQLISITKGAVLEESDTGSFTVNVAKNLVNWNDTTNTVENGELFILTFKIADDAESGQFEISISPKDNKVGNLATEEGQAIAASYVSGAVQISAINPFAPCSNSGHCPGIAFEDMPAVGNWAHDAIDWAVSTGVTVGTSETTFSPKKDCSRAEVVTFLWRAAGSPEPTTTECIFEDVKDGAYYEKAVIWAVENGITRGTSDTTFSPGKACSRAEVVTFLWRANGSPEVEGRCKFTDVVSGSYYEKAVIWAEQAGVTAGVSEDLFGPTNTCTRAQIVTFLFRNTVR